MLGTGVSFATQPGAMVFGLVLLSLFGIAAGWWGLVRVGWRWLTVDLEEHNRVVSAAMVLGGLALIAASVANVVTVARTGSAFN